MADNFDTLSIQITASASKAIEQVNQLADALVRLNGALKGIDASNLESVAGAADKFNNAISSFRVSGKKVESIATAFQHVDQASGNITNVQDSMQGLNNAINDAGQSADGVASTGMNNLANAANNTSNAMKRVAPAATKASNSIKKMGGSTLGAALTSKGLVKELTRIGKMLKLMITRMILRKVIQGVVDGFKNLVQYSDKFNATISLLWNSLRQLGNSIAAAASPLLNALAPAINYVIQLLIEAVNAINQFISALMGLGTFTKAKVLTDDYRKSLDKANGSAKELKKTVLGFDELNQLQDNNKGDNGTSAKDMFEEVPIDPRILKFIDQLKKGALDALDNLKKLWKSFKEGFKNGLGADWKKKVASIIDGAKRIKDALTDIFTDPRVTAAADRYISSLAKTIGTITGTIARIGLNIGVNLSQGIAASLEEKAPRIKDFLVEMFDIGTAMNEQTEQFSLALGHISDVIAGENGIAVTTNLTNIFTEAFMLISENAARVGQSILELLTQPIIDNQDQFASTFDGLLGTLANVTGTIDTAISDIRDTLTEVWNNSIYPIVEDVKETYSELTGIVLDFWNETLQPVLDDIADTFGDMWNQDLSPFFSDFITILGILGEGFTTLWKQKIVPVVDFIKTVFGPVIKSALDGVVASFKFAWNAVSLVIGTITKALAALLTFFKTGFTVGWKAACDGIKKDFGEMFDFMLQKAKNIVNAIVDGINAFTSGWIGAINGIISKLNNLPNVEINPIGEGFMKIPHWSTGGFPEDGLFMANHNELVGKFSNGKTAVANNGQITEGIASAVYSAIMSANGSASGGQYINNTIEIDGVAIARAVTKGQRSLDRRYSPTMA